MTTIDPTLIPIEVQRQVIEGVVTQSAALQLATVQPMPTGAEAIPVLGSFPQAGWLSAPGGRKTTTSMNWTAQQMKAEEVAAVIDVPIAYLLDAGFDIWGAIQPRMVEALAKAIDQAVLFGTAAPTSFPVGGVLAFSQAVAAPAAPANDMVGLYNATLSTVEAQGLEPNGIASDITVRGKLRGARTTQGQSLYVPAITEGMGDTIYGYPVAWSRGSAFDTTKAVSFTGDWTNLRIGIRQDVTVDQSDEGVLVDGSGNVIVSAFQDDKRLMRVHMRLGCVIGKPATAKAPGGALPWSHITTAVLPAMAQQDGAVYPPADEEVAADAEAADEAAADAEPANHGRGKAKAE
jgi:HK97 family phage major capsid protein